MLLALLATVFVHHWCVCGIPLHQHRGDLRFTNTRSHAGRKFAWITSGCAHAGTWPQASAVPARGELRMRVCTIHCPGIHDAHVGRTAMTPIWGLRSLMPADRLLAEQSNQRRRR